MWPVAVAVAVDISIVATVQIEPHLGLCLHQRIQHLVVDRRTFVGLATSIAVVAAVVAVVVVVVAVVIEIVGPARIENMLHTLNRPAMNKLMRAA